MNGAGFEEVDIGIAERELSREDGRRRLQPPFGDERLRQRIGRREALVGDAGEQHAAQPRQRRRGRAPRQAIAPAASRPAPARRRRSPCAPAATWASSAVRTRTRSGRRSREQRIERRHRPAPHASAPALARASASMSVDAGDGHRLADRVCRRRIAGSHFACATPPHPAIARLSGRFAGALRHPAGRRRRRRRSKALRIGRVAVVDLRPASCRPPLAAGSAPPSASVSAARMAEPLIRKNRRRPSAGRRGRC